MSLCIFHVKIILPHFFAPVLVNFTEINLEVITYIDLDNPRGREGNLCKKANSVCDGKLRLEDGDHEVVIKIYKEEYPELVLNKDVILKELNNEDWQLIEHIFRLKVYKKL